MTDYERTAAAAHQARIDARLDQAARDARVRAEDERRYRAAVQDFVTRVERFAWRPAAFDDAELAELDELAALLTAAQARGAILRARSERGAGLIRGLTGKSPTYDPSRVVPGNSGADWDGPVTGL